MSKNFKPIGGSGGKSGTGGLLEAVRARIVASGAKQQGRWRPATRKRPVA